MRRLVAASLRSRAVVLALGAALLIVGFVQLRDMPVDVLPEFGPPTVEVQTEALGLSAAEVEQILTVPMEKEFFNGLPFLDKIRSKSLPGLSSIELVFEPGTELAHARQLVQERLTLAHVLPNISKPPQMLQPLSASRRVMMVGLSSEDLSLIDMSVLARWTIRPRLLGVPGVANVAIWGERDRQLQVQVDPEVLRARRVSLDEVLATVGNALWVSPLTFLEASTPGAGGFFDTPNQRLGIQHVSPIRTPEDLAQVTLSQSAQATTVLIDGNEVFLPPPPQLRLGDVATVVLDHQPLIGDAVVNDGAGLVLVVEKFPDANVDQVTADVNAALADLAPGLRGIEVDASIFQPARYIDESIDNVTTWLLMSLGLLIAVAAAFFLSWRPVVISVVAIALSITAAALVLRVAGTTMNVMVLAGLVLALVVLVDDAVADTENIRRRVREHRADAASQATGNGDEEHAHTTVARVVLDASLERRRPMLYATLVLVLGMVPIFLLTGEGGAFLPPMVVAAMAAIASSMVVALCVTPVLCLTLFTSASSTTAPTAAWLERTYDRGLTRILGRSRVVTIVVLVVTGAVALVGLGAAFVLDQPSSLVPTLRDRDLLVHLDGEQSTGLPEIQRLAARAGAEIRELPGVSGVGGHVGRAVTADQIVGSNSAELWVQLDSSASYDETRAQIEEIVGGYPGLDGTVVTYANSRITDVLADEDDEDIVVRVFGDDASVVESKANEIERLVAKTVGVVTPRVELPIEEPTLEVQVNLAAAQRFGIKPGDVRRAAAILLSGITAGNLFEDQKVFDVVVWGAPQVRQSVSSVRELLLQTPTGNAVRLGDVADVRIAPGQSIIRHEDTRPFVDVVANVDGRSVGAVTGEIEDAVRRVDFPLEHHAEVLGTDADTQHARRLFLLLALAVVVGGFLMLQAALESWRLAALMSLALVASVAGGLVAEVIDGGDISVGVIAGLFAVFAFAVRNQIALFMHYEQLQLDEHEAFGIGLVRRGARERLAPLATTTVVVALAFLALLVLGDRAGYEIVRPMSIVVLGGVVTTTAVCLLVLPVLYLWAGPPKERTPRTAALVEDELVSHADGKGRSDATRFEEVHVVEPRP